jgi:DNA-binding IclR family transcriptional regulator
MGGFGKPVRNRVEERLMVATNDDKNGKRRGIQSVGIGLRVLSAVSAAQEPSTLSAIASRADLSASQTHRYLASLVSSGMVRQDGKSGLYDLGAGAIRIGLAALSRADLFVQADAIFRELSKSSKRTVMLAVWGDAGPTIVRWFAGSPPVVTSLAVGSTLPVLQSATGRVFFAFADGAQQSPLVKHEIKRLGMRAPELRSLADKVQSELSARIEGDLIPGLRALAAPVFDLQGRLVLVAALLANAHFASSDDDNALAALKESCAELTTSLGGRWPPLS